MFADSYPIQVGLSLQLAILAICLAFIILILKLNKFIKLLLVLMVTGNMICAISGILSSFLDKSYQCPFAICSFVAMVGSYTMTSLMSFLRLYMSKLASKAKLAKTKIVLPLTIFGGIFCLCFSALTVILQDSFGFQSLISQCEDSGERPKSVILPFLSISFLLGMIILGLYCDISLYKFVKKRNPNPVNNGLQIVPWKTTNQKSEEDLQVPLRASFISSFLFFFVLICAILSLVIVYEDNELATNFVIFQIIIFSTILPIIIISFTIKHQKKIGAAQPPQTLQFHEIELTEVVEIK